MAITVKHKFVSAIPDGDDSTVVKPSNWNDTHELTGLGTMAEQNANAVAITGGTISGVTIPASNLTGTVTVPQGGTGTTTLTGYVKGTGTAALTASGTIPNTDITGLGTASTKDAGVANGVATLDSSGTVPISQLPAAVLGALSYQGTWNASTNTPTLTSSVGTKGYYYVVNVAGSTNLNGITDWVVGDWAVYNGTAWQKVDNTDAVTSVNGYTGTVNLTYTDVGAFPATSTTGTGNVVLATGATQANPTISNYENFTPTTAPAYSEGRVWYDSTEKALAFYNDSSSIAVHVSQDLIFKVINNTGSTIANGAPVYITGTSSGQTYPNVALAKADVAATSAVIGLTNGSIANGAFGYVTSQGTIDNVNTSTFTVGQVLYLSPYSAGQLMNTIPPTGITVQVGVVSYVDSSAGHIYVKQTTPLAVPASIITGTLGVDHGGTGATTLTGYVKGSGTSAMTASATIPTTDLSGTITNAQLANSAITINGTSTSLGGSVSVGTVTSVAATAGTGISISGSPITSSGTLTITNTAPDQTVAISSGTGISVSGTYPNFTVTNTAPSSGGTVTSVTGTAPVVSSGGNTPAISMAKATGSVDGYLSATDWTTFNSKAPATSGSSILYGNGSGGFSNVTVGSGLTFSAGTLASTATGTVTSVAATVPAFLSVSGSPVTTSGTLAISYSGTALPVANGGTGSTTATGSGSVVLATSPTITTPVIDKINTSITNVSLGAGNSSSSKNRLINGAMNINQRATTLSTNNSSGYYIDRTWGFSSNVAATFTQGTSSGLTGFPNYARAQRTAGGSNGAYYTGQIIESNNLQDLQGQSVTVSFWARCGANYSPTSSILVVYLNTGTTADQGLGQLIAGWTGVVSQTANVTLTTSWQRFSATFTIGSTVQEICPFFTANATGTAGAADYFDITGFQLEIGTQMTGFDYRLYGQDLQLCQRYYYQLLGGTVNNITLNGYCFSLTQYNAPVSFPVQMRTAPTLNATSGSGYYYLDAGGGNALGSWTIYTPNKYGGLIYTSVTGGAGGYAGGVGLGNASASIAFSAEL